MTIALRQPSSGRAAAVAFAVSLAAHGAVALALLSLSVARPVAIEFPEITVSLAPAAATGPAPRASGPTPDAEAPAQRTVAPRPRVAAPAPRVVTTRAEADFAVPAPPVVATAAPLAPEARADAAAHDAVVADAAAPAASTDAPDADGFVELHVLDWLAQHRRYPRAAARARIEGVVHVRFKLVPDGRIVDTRLERSSGARILDGAALELLDRASPIPGLAQFAMTRPIELRLPIQYRLRRSKA
jgi:protein TonB